MKKVNNTEFQLNTRIRIKNIIGEDSYLNGMTGTVCEPFAFAESGQGWIGVILDSSRQPMPYGGKCNIRINECEIISDEDIIVDLCNEMLVDSFKHMKNNIKRELKTYCELYWWNMGKKTLSFKGNLGDLLKEQNITFSKRKTETEGIFTFHFKSAYGISFKTTGLMHDFTHLAKQVIQMELVRMGDKSQLYVAGAWRPTVTVNF